MKTNKITRIAMAAVLMIAFCTNTFAQQDNREWWNSLSPAWKKVFREQELKGKDVEPSDEQLAMIVLCENMECGGNKEITDLKPLRRLTNLTMLDCSNTNIKSLDGIQFLTGLKELDCSNNDNLNSLDLQATLGKVNTTMDNVQTATDKLNSKEGSLGLLLNDTSLYGNLNTTVNSATGLLEDLKANPQRYVHFSLIGKKSKKE